jgi:alkylation response protein AidB-like acyl-CoA dehydrogenase
MRFAFTDQQLEFRDAVRQVLTKECTTADVRAAFEEPGTPSGRWAALADMGIIGMTIPEDLGGLGLGLIDVVPLVEEAGRVALPEPLGLTAGVAAPLLTACLSGDDAGASARARTWLERIAHGESVAAIGTHAAPDVPVAGAAGADLLLMTAIGPDGPAVHAVAAADVSITPVPTLDQTRRLASVAWQPETDTVVASSPLSPALLERTAQRAAVITAAELLGLADAMIDMTAAYAKERQQFGKPIGSFQAIKHLLAGAQVLLEFARPTVYGAAWALDHDEADAGRSASVAKAYASEAALESARVSLQVHGAIGYTWECDLQLFLKRSWALAEAWGSASDHRALVLESLISAR